MKKEMFTEKEIKLMRSIGLDFDFQNISGDQWAEIEEKVGDKLVISGLDKDYYPNEIGWICEGIIDKIPKSKLVCWTGRTKRPYLTHNEEYIVMSEKEGEYEIIDDTDEIKFYPAEGFVEVER